MQYFYSQYFIIILQTNAYVKYSISLCLLVFETNPIASIRRQKYKLSLSKKFSSVFLHLLIHFHFA